MKILLVGGAVRNLLLGRHVADKDFLVSGSTRKEFLSHFPQAKEVGHHFPVFLVDGDEYSFPRADSLAKDLEARDFTINGLALDESGKLYAHPLALADLHARILRPASPSAFQADPIRVFRAARFLAELDDFSPSDELRAAMCDASAMGLLDSLSPERVGAELTKAMSGSRPSRFLSFLQETNCLKPWFHEFFGSDTIPAGPLPLHSTSVLGHTMEVMDRLAPGGPLRVWMGMVHDLGKTLTSSLELPRHLGHDTAGEALAVALGTRLRLSNRFLRAGALAARLHMKAGRYPELRPGTRVDLLTTLKFRPMIKDLFILCAADHGQDYTAAALTDLEAIRAVRLKPQDRDRGAISGRKLHQLQVEAIIRI
ncbi:MAG: tRNA nucleotidyltransferase [Proteobacteria bacterium]|nr:tRNA nucleotidyltransferase [Pseudomonadota bacterium]MBU1611144.1 tRNA nucleotidyltransferase [Pseudomonadota bacterium]